MKCVVAEAVEEVEDPDPSEVNDVCVKHTDVNAFVLENFNDEMIMTFLWDHYGIQWFRGQEEYEGAPSIDTTGTVTICKPCYERGKALTTPTVNPATEPQS